MDTIWTKIIWEKLGNKECKLHEHTSQQLTKLVMEWIAKTPREEIVKTIEEIGAPIEKDYDYYDGPFHVLGRMGEGAGSALVFHDNEIEPIVIGLFLAFPRLLQEMDLIKSIVEKCHPKEEKA